MSKFNQRVLSLISNLIPATPVSAHCDYPCGIYDPHLAQIGALTVIRMMNLMNELETGHEHHDLEFQNSMTRAITIKEEHAELVKREVRVIWGDYFKDEHLKQYPEINELVHNIMQLASKCRQTAERDNGTKLLEAVNKFSEIFWETKNKETKRVKAPYKPEEEIVYPQL